VTLVKNGDSFALKCTPCDHQVVYGYTVNLRYNIMKECVIANKCWSNYGV